MKKQKIDIKGIIEAIKEPLMAVLAALLISSFIISHTKVPTASMMPTIKPGDHLIVNRLPYYYRNPVRGEIAVFAFEGDNLIKRVIGVPGDVVDIKDSNVYINGKKFKEAYLQTQNSTYLFAGSKVEFPYTIPEGFYFMMGDNRNNSKDSRVFGPIPRTHIIAKAGLRIYPFNRVGMVH